MGCFGIFFLFVDPAFDPDDAVKRAGFGKAVFERHAESLQRHFAFAVGFRTGDVRATEAAGDAEADALGPELHGGLNGTLHGAAEADTALELDGDLLGDELGVEFRLADFEDVEFDLGPLAEVGDVIGHDLDFLALAADDEAGTGGLKCDADAVPSAFDDDLGEAGVLELLAQVLTDREVFVKLVGEVLASGVPFGTPVLVNGEAKCDWIYFLAHDR